MKCILWHSIPQAHKPGRLDLVPRRRFLLKPMLLNTTDRQDFLVKRALRVRSITLTPFLLTPSFPDPFVPSCHDKGKYSRYSDDYLPRKSNMITIFQL